MNVIARRLAVFGTQTCLPVGRVTQSARKLAGFGARRKHGGSTEEARRRHRVLNGLHSKLGLFVQRL